MKSVLDKWNPPVLDKPDYFDTVKYVYKHIEFHISEDQAYTILNAFIEKWDECAGQEIFDEELKGFVIKKLQDNFEVMLPTPKIKRVVELILGYLYETGHYFQNGKANSKTGASEKQKGNKRLG
ncbi:MAG: hypothetical protein IPP77_03470 [Bacteroidetes bacterium]|nr:hypothetical protein [Bacteroidota bacterium]